MYAIIEERGTQYKVREGEIFEIALCDEQPGARLTVEKVLLLSADGAIKVGAPALAGAAVELEVLGEVKGKKLRIAKYKRRKNNRWRIGHRQHYTRVRVAAIRG